jgi:hypothetical protein
MGGFRVRGLCIMVGVGLGLWEIPVDGLGILRL